MAQRETETVVYDSWLAIRYDEDRRNKVRNYSAREEATGDSSALWWNYSGETETDRCMNTKCFLELAENFSLEYSI